MKTIPLFLVITTLGVATGLTGWSDELTRGTGLTVAVTPVTGEISTEAATAFKSRLLAATTRHLNLLLRDGEPVALKGKTTDGQAALAFYLAFEATGEQKFHHAALVLASRVLQAMRATKFGVLAIKDKEKPGGDTISGGGPPALGFYVTAIAYILHRETGHDDDLKYLATVIDRYPWNENGWWAADIDVETGESKLPLTKPSPLNKTASIAMAAGVLSAYVGEIAPDVASRLKQKTDACLYKQILPAQLADGFWNYSLSGKDPGNKDILGYFMLTTQMLMELQHFNPAYHEPKLDAALQKAQAFAATQIAPMTDPNTGQGSGPHLTPATPRHYTLADNSKRSFQLGLILIGAGNIEGIKIMDSALGQFPLGDAGQDGVHAAEPCAFLLSWLP